MHIVAVETYPGDNWERHRFDDRMDAIQFAEQMVELGYRVFVYHP